MQEKWIALSNTTIGQLMATINTSIIIVALPSIFVGIHLNPMQASSFPYLLWLIMSYMIVLSVLLVSIGKLSDIFGRVKIFNLGFLIFTIGSILLYIAPGTGYTVALELIIFRIVQAVGGAFIMANTFAIITDNFSPKERGFAISINSVAAVSGVSIGVVLGGILSTIYWRDIFLISIPIGVFGTLWSFLKLKDVRERAARHIDIPGNILFAVGLIILLLGVTYGITPYKNNPMGWTNPLVISALAIGAIMLVLFPFVENRVKGPMFDMRLFKSRNFSISIFTAFVSAMTMMGLMYMLTLIFQGIWLPIRGYRYAVTPLWAGIYMLPLPIFMGIFGVLSSKLADRFDARWLTTIGLFISGFALLALVALTYNFSYVFLSIVISIFGIGYGIFNVPNLTVAMSSVPADERGATSGILNTMRNTGYAASIGAFFSILLLGLSLTYPGSITHGLTVENASSLVQYFNNIPPTEILFSTFLGLNTVKDVISTVPAGVISGLPSGVMDTISGHIWFPETIAPAFMTSMHDVFYVGFGASIIAGLASLFRTPSDGDNEAKVRDKDAPRNNRSK
ncbi:drug:H+ antiporter-2 family transporter [Ferroplasma acidiphilum]|uniref:Drug:H+ antiporter-2 family transporter n=1 Tax=Ferroplasma acidiphilum TaxID=74969 RepID=A0A1V0N4G3_9ARCH|nr:MFS transporter [Ferroplasma acidiphilum]ARD84994.1 drug:H+ antiporter-2 family transporter [Ferroplasma acidiphilum]